MGPIQGDNDFWMRMKAWRLSLEDIGVRTALARKVIKERRDGLKSEFSLGGELERLLSEKRLEYEVFLHLQKGPIHVHELSQRLKCTEDKVIDLFSRLSRKEKVDKENLILKRGDNVP